ncbi:MAG: hypothetical protein HKN79_08265 [Flavobacteriales bacterium]|nr:hypothetical protein [Flavobacteriales bacterium]
MENFWIIALSLFVFNTLLIWRVTRKYFKREYGKAMWKNWTVQTYHWQGAIYLSTGLTFLMLVLLKWADLLSL